MRTQLRAALEESLIDGPDPAEVLAGIHTGIARRRRRNRYYRIGFAISAIVLVLIVSVAAASVATNRDERAPALPVGVWTNTVRATWLPAGMTAFLVRTTAFGEELGYGSPEYSLQILVDNVGRGQVSEGPGWQPIEINGRPGLEHLNSTAAWINFELPSGRRAEVHLDAANPGAAVAQPFTRDEAIRIARSLEETGNLPLRTKFAPSYLPPNQRIIGVETTAFALDGFGTLVCAAGSLLSKREGVGVRISVTGDIVITDPDVTTRIADIQGRPAYRTLSGGTVYVAGFHGGTLTVEATLERGLWPTERNDPPYAGPPLTELIRIAQGVRWTG